MSLAAAMQKDEAENFESFEQIFKMYAPKGAIKGLENLQPPGSDRIITHPLELLHAIFNTRTEGDGGPSSELYPLPGVVAGLQ